MGDFNINLLNTSHSGTNEFLDILESNFFNPHILQPTRITDHSATLIDNIFFNSLTHHTISGNIAYDLTDHLPNFLIVNKFSTLPKHFKMTRRDYSKFDSTIFSEEIRSTDWFSDLANCNDSSLLFKTFYSKLTSIVDKHIPTRQVSLKEMKQRTKPWITPGIRTSINVKNKFYKKYIKQKSNYYHDKFKLYRNRLNHLIKASKRLYYNQYFKSNRSNIRMTWNGIKEIIGLKRGNFNLPSKILTNNNVELSDCESIAKEFNEFLLVSAKILLILFLHRLKVLLILCHLNLQIVLSLNPLHLWKLKR